MIKPCILQKHSLLEFVSGDKKKQNYLIQNQLLMGKPSVNIFGSSKIIFTHACASMSVCMCGLCECNTINSKLAYY